MFFVLMKKSNSVVARLPQTKINVRDIFLHSGSAFGHHPPVEKFQKTLILAFDVHCFYQIYSFIHVLAQSVTISHNLQKRSFD